MDDQESDEELMRRYQAGEAQAFERLYARHKGGLYRYFLRQCGPAAAAVAEELFQDVWLNLIRARRRYEPRAKFATYLYTLAHHRLIDHYRRQRSGLPLSFDDDPDDPLVERTPDERVPEPADALDARRQAARLLALLAELPEAQREAFLLREEGGLTLEEIAQATGVAAETAKSRVRYALAKLRAGLAANAARRSTERRA